MSHKRTEEIVVATTNRGKIVEIQKILSGSPYEFVPITQFDAHFFVEEDGMSYAENAIKKARRAALTTGKIALADDSGLEVDALGGAPGIYSARFGGEDLPFPEKIARLLREMDGQVQRTARFRCVIAVASPKGTVASSEGVCEGVIAAEPRGTNGFGFDPIFWVPAYQKTMAELWAEIKNEISHRARALRHVPALIEQVLAA